MRYYEEFDQLDKAAISTQGTSSHRNQLQTRTPNLYGGTRTRDILIGAYKSEMRFAHCDTQLSPERIQLSLAMDGLAVVY